MRDVLGRHYTFSVRCLINSIFAPVKSPMFSIHQIEKYLKVGGKKSFGNYEFCLIKKI